MRRRRDSDRERERERESERVKERERKRDRGEREHFSSSQKHIERRYWLPTVLYSLREKLEFG